MKYAVAIFITLLFSSAKCQEVQLLEQIPFSLPDSTLAKIQKDITKIRSVVALINFYHITYLSDGLKVKGYLAVPKKDGKYPCVIYNRGGNKEFSKNTEESFTRSLSEISSVGYIVIASQYRGNDGGEGVEEFGGKDVDDVLNLIPLLNSLPQADTSRIGMFGYSRGGMMTYLALSKTKRIKAAVVQSGMADLIKIMEARPEFDTASYAHLIPGYARNKMAALRERSATYFADKINKTTPILILQGTADWRNPTNQVLDLVTRLYEVKQPIRFILYEGAQHSLQEFRSDYITQIIQWFNLYLRDEKRLPSLEPHGH